MGARTSTTGVSEGRAEERIKAKGGKGRDRGGWGKDQVKGIKDKSRDRARGGEKAMIVSGPWK